MIVPDGDHGQPMDGARLSASLLVFRIGASLHRRPHWSVGEARKSRAVWR
jgi:hypothetical protein